MISKEKIKKVAELSMLKFSEEEIANLTERLNKKLENIEKVKEVDTENIKPTFQVNNNYQYLRDDKIEDSFSKEEALKNAPDEQFGYFKLPKVLD